MPDPYIHFHDCCREAMEFYRDVFGGTLNLMGYAQMPDAPEEVTSSDKIMHATLSTSKGPIYASDAFPGHTAPPQTSMSISWGTDAADEGQSIFNALLADGGEVTMPYAETFFSPGFGMVKDRFGTHWMIMTYSEQG